MATNDTLKLIDKAVMRRHRGEALIDVSGAVYTGYIELFTIDPGEQALEDVRVYLDLDKDTTGFGVVNTTETIQFAVARKVDGTNFRIAVGADGLEETATTTGTIAGGQRAQVLHLGLVDGPVQVLVRLSAETGGDCRIPFQINYKAAAEIRSATPLFA